jgi:hypothetical protein
MIKILPFRTIAKGEDARQLPHIIGDESHISELYLINQERSFNQIQERLLRHLPRVDFENYSVIAAFCGQKPVPGYHVYITKLVQDQYNNLGVLAIERSPLYGIEPEKGLGFIAVSTRPYHIIETPKLSTDTNMVIVTKINQVVKSANLEELMSGLRE